MFGGRFRRRADSFSFFFSSPSSSFPAAPLLSLVVGGSERIFFFPEEKEAAAVRTAPPGSDMRSASETIKGGEGFEAMDCCLMCAGIYLANATSVSATAEVLWQLDNAPLRGCRTGSPRNGKVGKCLYIRLLCPSSPRTRRGAGRQCAIYLRVCFPLALSARLS
ncbi:hypothetical protein GGS23DRAFT_368190 [Durotheca rogersii]|uniref:uncharacterized protein n=1 Tax=Durotheca rogersii TaxID=419775 RepID=UPI00221F0483|nr:uncharacterized protein GGS23DRAFT_368190 [Durotheca rogersii]KAI5866096.1 hypothetical protein GGS23DRAFT_368190 [Durotheca rogersii]